MTINVIEDFRDAGGERVQPYFAAFMIEHGYTSAKEPFESTGTNLEYLEWNRRMWAEFERETGMSVRPRHHMAPEFTKWLNARAVDHACRNHVEAA